MSLYYFMVQYNTRSLVELLFSIFLIQDYYIGIDKKKSFKLKRLQMDTQEHLKNVSGSNFERAKNKLRMVGYIPKLGRFYKKNAFCFLFIH